MKSTSDLAGDRRGDRAVDSDPIDDSVIVNAAISVFRALPMHRVTMKMVAQAAATNVATLRTRFPTLEDLVAEVVDVWNTRRREPLLIIAKQHGAVTFLRTLLEANMNDPALLRLTTASTSIAATPELAAAAVLQSRWIRFHASVQRALVHDVAAGREPETMDPARGAEQLIALYDGLQLQAMLRPHMNALEAYDRAVTRLRSGWSTTYTPPVWNL